MLAIVPIAGITVAFNLVRVRRRFRFPEGLSRKPKRFELGGFYPEVLSKKVSSESGFCEITDVRFPYATRLSQGRAEPEEGLHKPLLDHNDQDNAAGRGDSGDRRARGAQPQI